MDILGYSVCTHLRSQAVNIAMPTLPCLVSSHSTTQFLQSRLRESVQKRGSEGCKSQRINKFAVRLSLIEMSERLHP